MINQVVVQGRISNEPSLGETQKGTKKCFFNVAVERRGQDDSADFVPVICYGNLAENFVKYKEKGDPVAVTGSITAYGEQQDDGSWEQTVMVTARDIDYQSIMGNSANAKSGNSTDDPDEILDDVDTDFEDDDDEFEF